MPRQTVKRVTTRVKTTEGSGTGRSPKTGSQWGKGYKLTETSHKLAGLYTHRWWGKLTPGVESGGAESGDKTEYKEQQEEEGQVKGEPGGEETTRDILRCGEGTGGGRGNKLKFNWNLIYSNAKTWVIPGFILILSLYSHFVKSSRKPACCLAEESVVSTQLVFSVFCYQVF